MSANVVLKVRVANRSMRRKQNRRNLGAAVVRRKAAGDQVVVAVAAAVAVVREATVPIVAVRANRGDVRSLHVRCHRRFPFRVVVGDAGEVILARNLGPLDDRLVVGQKVPVVGAKAVVKAVAKDGGKVKVALEKHPVTKRSQGKSTTAR